MVCQVACLLPCLLVCVPVCVHGWACVCADLYALGYRRVVFKDDTEPALVSFLQSVKRSWDGEVVPEHSATGEIQSHGGAERAVQTVEGFTRTLKDALETHLQQPLRNS